jgi:tetratricopeptide (TPR) repeat protein
MPIGQASSSNGGLVGFRNISPGRYSIEVEASGYAPAHEAATLPLAGEAHVEIYLRPESNADPIVIADPATPLLAPKARKELDAGQQALIGKDLKQAQKHLDKAGQLAPMHPDVLYLLGILYSQMNDLLKAEQFLLKVAQLEPQQVRAHAALGVVLADERKFDEAVTPLGKALELDAHSWESRWALARCYYHQRKFQSALEQSRQALGDSKGLAPDIALVLAGSLGALGQYEESAATLREYIQQHPDRSGALRAQHWLDRLQQAGKIKPN